MMLARLRTTIILATALVVIGGAIPSVAQAPAATIAYQVMTDGGLTTGQPFEAWVVFGDPNPAAPGYALPAGSVIRVTFPPPFTPEPVSIQGVVLLYGWSQGSIDVPYAFAKDPADPRTIVITIKAPITVQAPERPGLKAIHLRTDLRNPLSGNYPIKIALLNAGQSNGTLDAVAHIGTTRVPHIAQYNQLHESRDEDYQHVQPGQAVPLPIDLLVTRNDEPRATLQLAKRLDGGLNIVADGKPIGKIEPHGVPVTLTPHPFGPGFARLGIVEFTVQAGQSAGAADIEAELDGGTGTTLHVLVGQ